MAKDITITVTIEKRPLLSRLAIFPSVIKNHYALFRESGLGVIKSLYGGWLMAGLLFRI